MSSLRNTRQELRRSVRKDRRDWLHQLAVQAPDIPVRDVVRQLRPLLRASGKRQACRRSIPAVLTEDGVLAQSPAEAAARLGTSLGLRVAPLEL